MPVYAPVPLPFCCAICGAEQMTSPWSKYPRAENPIPPICRYCESTWGRAVGKPNDLNRDKRMIRQISALAEVISCSAHCIQNNHRPPYDRA